MKAIVIAGVTSGVGKTTVSTGVMGALRKRGLKVQPFKAGPDYIDPTYHMWVTGEPSRNLDTWLLSKNAIIELFTRAMKGKDIAVIEGVMGLFDGRSPVGDEGSTAELAKLLGAPVLIVIDSRKGARSLAAIVEGYRSFDRHLQIGGVILNGIGSDGHLRVCREAIEHYTGIRVLGHLPRREELSIPERHLGLIPTVERADDRRFLDGLIEQCDTTFDISAILSLSERVSSQEVEPELFPAGKQPPVTSIGIARDKAFSFYYQDSLDLLDAWGAELKYFSPLNDVKLPEGVSGLYFGGGFPELYAAQLEDNTHLRQAINDSFVRGMPVYAECGGLMYLGKSLQDFQGENHRMVGAIPFSSRIDSPHLSLGYRTVKALGDGPLLKQGQEVRGHEFHWSVRGDNTNAANAYCVVDKGGYREGFHQGNLLASYIHLHMASQPSMVTRFIENCRRFRVAQKA